MNSAGIVIDTSILEKEVPLKNPEDTHPKLTGDWWETLFQPRYGVLDYEVPRDSGDEDEDTCTRSDPTSDEPNVYRRVWRREQKGVRRVYRPRADLELVHAEINEIADKLLNIREATTQTDECIWNTKEVHMMRKYVKDVKGENMKLRALTMEQSQRLEEVERKCKSQSKELTKKRSALSEAVKANDRFHILTEALSDHTQRGGALCSHLEDQLIQRQTEIAQLRRELESKGEKMVRLEQNNKRIKARTESIMQDFARKTELAVDTATLTQAEELKAVYAKVDQLTLELRREREKHIAVNRGCQQLLKHYSQEHPIASSEIRSQITLAEMKIL